MSYLEKIRGTIEDIFRIGRRGPQLKNNSGAVEVRNATDSALAIARAATPVGDTDLTTKLYVDSLEKILIVKRQADCSVALPNNTSTAGFVAATTFGSGTVAGDLLYDDGSAIGTMEIQAAVNGRTIAVTVALIGGTIEFDANSMNQWDAEGGAWVKIGDISSVAGAIRQIRFALNTDAQQDSPELAPANARGVRCDVDITTPYTGGTTITVGNTTTADLLQEAADNTPHSIGTYSVDVDVDWGGSASAVRVTVAGSPAAGAGFLVFRFANPIT